jgi:hypothetical protein
MVTDAPFQQLSAEECPGRRIAILRKEKSLMGASQTFDGNLHGFFMPCTLSSDHDVYGSAPGFQVRNLLRKDPGNTLYETFTTFLHRPYGSSDAME